MRLQLFAPEALPSAETMLDGLAVQPWLGEYVRNVCAEDVSGLGHVKALCVLADRCRSEREKLGAWIHRLDAASARLVLREAQDMARAACDKVSCVAFTGMKLGVTSSVLNDAHKALQAYDDVYCLLHMLCDFRPDIAAQAVETLNGLEHKLQSPFKEITEIMYAPDQHLASARWWDPEKWHMWTPFRD